MISNPRNQLKWLRSLKLLSHPKLLRLLKHRRPLKLLNHLRCSRAEVCRLSRLFPLYRQSQAFRQYRQCQRCLLFRAAISAFAGLAPSSTT